MLDIIGIVMIVFIALYVLVIPRYNLLNEVCKYTADVKDNGELDINRVKIFFSSLPFIFNLAIVKKLYANNTWVKIVYGSCLAIATIAFSLKQFLYENVQLNIISTLALLIVIVVIYLTDSIVAFNCSRLMQCTLLVKLLSILIPLIGVEFTASAVSKVFEEASDDIKGTFEGNKEID